MDNEEREHGLYIDDEVIIKPRGFNLTAIEPPVKLRKGIYDIESIGAFTYMGGRESSFRHIKSVGRFCSIAGDIVAGEAEHPVNHLSAHPLFQGGWDEFGDFLDDYYRENSHITNENLRSMRKALGKRREKIVIGNNVWIGQGVFIRRGVTIGDGAVVAARSVVIKDVEPYTIVGGSPSSFIRYRYSEKQIDAMKELCWWKFGLSILKNVRANNLDLAIPQMRDNISRGVAEIYAPNQIMAPPTIDDIL